MSLTRLAPAAAPAEAAASAEGAGVDVLVFRIGRTTYGACIDQIREIAEVDDFTRLTAPDPSLRGYLLARGRPIPMIDVARRLGLPAPPRYAAPVLMVAEVGGSETGFLVDDPEDVVTLGPEDFRALPELVTRTMRLHAPYALGIHGGALILMLDLEALVSAEEAREALAMAERAHGGAA